MLFFSALLGGLTYVLAFEREMSAVLALESQLVQTVRAQAEVAVYASNKKIADGVIDGLLANARIASVEISGDGFTSRATGPVVPDTTLNSDYPLFSPLDGQRRIGAMRVTRNAGLISREVTRTAIQQAVLMLALLVATVILIMIVFRQLLGKPVADLAASLALVRPGQAQRIPVSPDHAGDEIGSLARTVNGLLDAVDAALRDLRGSKQKLADALTLLTEKEQSKSRFFAAANHDLRQPVHAINLFLEALETSKPRPDQVREVKAIKSATQTLNDLLDSLLDISKLDAGAVLPTLEWISLEEVFSRLDNSFSALALQRQLRFKFWFPRGSFAVHTDQHLLMTILSNLVGNAFKYTESGGVLVVFRKRDRAWAFQIFDTGIGISAEHIDRIYDEFYQVANPGRSRAKGLGLGLAIVRRTVDLLAYRLSCLSRPGKGTVFEFKLPMDFVRQEVEDSPHLESALVVEIDERAAQDVTTHSETDEVSAFRGQSFVVLEDDQLVAEALRMWLSGLGCTVNVFASGEAALLSAAVDDADYFVADVQLEGELTGPATLAGIQLRRGEPVRAVVVTGNTRSLFVGDLAHGCWPVLFKPVTGPQILSALTKGKVSA